VAATGSRGGAEGVDGGLGEFHALVKLAAGKQPGIAGELIVRWHEDDGASEEIQAFFP
jgi:hypothetical protein